MIRYFSFHRIEVLDPSEYSSTTCYRYIVVVPIVKIVKGRINVYYNVRPAREVSPNQIKYRFHDHNREGVGVSSVGVGGRRTTRTTRKERKKDTVRQDKETD